jgi:hypothetical protein
MKRWGARLLLLFALTILPGCAAPQQALPGLFAASSAVATDLSAAERARAEATRCEAGRKKTAAKLDAIAAELHEVRGYVAADAAQERDAGAVQSALDAGAEGGL